MWDIRRGGTDNTNTSRRASGAAAHLWVPALSTGLMLAQRNGPLVHGHQASQHCPAGEDDKDRLNRDDYVCCSAGESRI